MSRLDRLPRLPGMGLLPSMGFTRRSGPAAASGRTGAARGMPLRHKLMLVLAVEILAMGFRQADMNRHDKGIVVETPAHAGNAIV